MSVSEMRKLTAFSYKSDADALMRKLTNLRSVHVKQVEINKDSSALGLSKFDKTNDKNLLENNIGKIKNALKILYPYSARKKSLISPRIEVDINRFLSSGKREKTLDVVNEVADLSEKFSKLEETEREENQLAASLTPWLSYPDKLGFDSTEATKIILGFIPSGVEFDTLQKKVDDFYAYVEKIYEEKGMYVRFICYEKDERDLIRALQPLGFIKASFKKDFDVASVELDKCKKRLAEISAEKESIIAKYKELSKHLNNIEILYDVEQTSLNIINEEMKLGATEYTAYFDAWVPKESEKAVARILESFETAYEFRDPKPYEEPPTYLMNNGFARNFEWVIGMYSYPKYGSFDPTFIMSIFYFILFGIMFADVGYGLILSAVCFLGVKLLKPQEAMQRFLLMFGYCGISSIFMGALFGGWFGDLPFAIATKMLGMENAKEIIPFFNGMWFNPLDDPMKFLIVSLALGGAHIVAGMAIKFYILCKDGKIFDAIFDVGSWWVVFAGLGLLFVNSIAGAIISLIGVVMLVATQGRAKKGIVGKIFGGIGSLYNIVSYLSDLLSYSRILALGMVAGVIGQVVNMITGLGKSFFGFIVMIIVLIVGHLLNLVLNVLGTFVHTARLQYIEFFGKFYEEGGKPFKPATPSDKYTIEKH